MQPPDARAQLFKAIRERAKSGDFAVLIEAHQTGDAKFYGEVLDAVIWGGSKDVERLCALAAYIIEHKELRADDVFAKVLLMAWRLASDQVSITTLLHIAALSDDAAVYEKVVEAVLESWKTGSLPEFTAEGLNQLFESEYWVLGADAKRSGAGFVLKETLADARRQLSTTTTARRASNPHEAG